MNNFKQYAEYYNLLYKDKDYKSEAEYVEKLFLRFNPNSKTILDLGCGSGKHDFYWAKEGYEVTGIDDSKEMLKEADTAKKKFGFMNVHFIHENIQRFNSRKKFDVVTSLFHVISYQNTNEEVRNVFNNVSNHLKSGGIFIFDFWYGPAVLTIKPDVRIKRIKNKRTIITRIAEPLVDYSQNLVNVNYDIFVEDTHNHEITEIKEKHSMRFFFETEIIGFLEANQLEILEKEEWITGHALDENTWSALYIAKKNKIKNKVTTL